MNDSTHKRSLIGKASPRLVFVLVLFLFTGGTIVYLSLQIEIASSQQYLNRAVILLNLFDLFALEMIIFLLLFELLYRKHVSTRYFLYILFFIYIFVYLIQTKSIDEGGEYLSILAIENIDHLYLFINIKSIVYSVFIVLLFSLFVIFLEKNHLKNNKINNKYIFTLIIVSTVLLVTNNNNWFFVKGDEYKVSFLDYESVKRSAPLFAIYQVLTETRKQSKMSAARFDKRELIQVEKIGFSYNPRSRYPLVKDTIYKFPPPFEEKPDSPSMPNVIVIFSEGVSARSIGAYGSAIPDITPEIDRFAQSSMIVHNYYNHTAATYRGLLGQLCSLFPIFGGSGWETSSELLADTRYFSIAELMRKKGYETIFLDSHHKRHVSRVDEMIEQLGFTSVITGDELARRYLNSAEPALRNAFSDQQFFKGLIGYLKERAASNTSNESFFLGMYNFGTHAFLKRGGDVIEYGDGSNYVLNNFYSFDNSFGLFWNYFINSPYYKNTIVILTADHCHYPEKAFVKAFNTPDYQGFFVDKIPLIIYDPTRRLPKEYDAQNTTSLDFAPSLAHYLELPNSQNPFLGSSIFEQRRDPAHTFGISFIGDQRDLFIIKDQKISRLDSNDKALPNGTLISKFIEVTQQLELDNRIWNRDQ